jgi:hypothetical protein
MSSQPAAAVVSFRALFVSCGKFGLDMSSASVKDFWYHSGWRHRAQIRVDRTLVSGEEDLIDFPLKLDHQGPEMATALPNGHDFVFTSVEGSKLSHEIASWDPATARLVAFVKIPRLSSKEDTLLYLYWGNPASPDQGDVDGTWDDHTLFTKHLDSGPLAREHHGPRGGCLAHKDFFALQLRILDDLFGVKWFRNKSRDHLAQLQWNLCQEIISAGGMFQFKNSRAQQELTLQCARLLGDAAKLVESTEGDLATFRLGDLANYGDEKVTARLKSVIKDSHQYEDVLAELTCAAWHISKGHSVSVSEDPSRPDFRIVVPGWPLPVLADSKRIFGRALKNSINGHLKKANKQIKAASEPTYGLAILDITTQVSQPRELSDRVPVEVVRIEEDVRRELSKHFRSLSGAVLVWNEHVVLASVPYRVMAVIRTRSLVVRHRSPYYVLPAELGPIMIAFTVQMSSRSWQSSLPTYSTNTNAAAGAAISWSQGTRTP